MDKYHKIVWEDVNEILASSVPWDMLRGKSVLISGANGGISAYLVYTLLSLNTYRQFDIQIFGLVRNKERAQIRFSDVLNRKDFTLLVQDVCEPVKIEDPIDYIIHAASNTTPHIVLEQPIDTLNGNYLGTLHLLELAREKNANAFLYLSSDSVYGYNKSKEVKTENDFYGSDPIDIRCCYIEAKRAGEMLCAAYYKQHKSPIICVRLSSILLPGLYAEKGSHLAEFAQLAAKGDNIVLKSRGSSLRTYVPARDAISGIFWSLLKGLHGEAYNVAHKKCILTIFEMAKIFMQLGDKRLEVIVGSDAQSDVEFGIRHFCVDGSKLEALGWKPVCNIEKAVHNMIEGAKYE